MINVAVVGIGCMGKGIVRMINRQPDMHVVAELGRTTKELVLESKTVDVLVDATGDVDMYQYLLDVLCNDIHVVAMNCEVDQTFGAHLNNMAKHTNAVYTSDAGDQHGVLARLINEVESAGLDVVMAGNNKAYIDMYANPDTQREYAKQNGLNINKCVSFADGTKLAMEMSIVANAFGLDVMNTGMCGRETYSNEYLDEARKRGGIVEYRMTTGNGVFVIGYTQNPDDMKGLQYFKMGDGPYYAFYRPYHLCYFETPYAIRQAYYCHKPVLTQKDLHLDVGTFAKTSLKAGTVLDGVGGYHTYGLLMHEDRKILPINLSKDVKLLVNKKKDDPIYEADIKRLWR